MGAKMMKRMVYISLALFIMGVIANAIYQQMHKQSPNLSILPCQKEVVVYEKIYDATLLKQAQKAVFEGSVLIASRIKKSHYMPSRLFKYVDKKSVDLNFIEALQNMGGNKAGSSKVKIDYYIYENDKNDPGKKTPKSKLYAGYLYVTFFYEEKRCYVMQIDFMDDQGRDIPKRVECALKTFLSAKSDASL
jgi:hypothetical protein